MTRYIKALTDYAVKRGLIEPDDTVFVQNRLLERMGLFELSDERAADASLPEILRALCDDAVSRGVCADDTVSRDLFDTALMGELTPFPHEVRARFAALSAKSPEKATDWYYAFSQDTNYIRRDRIARDEKWTYDCEYGTLDVTVNLSKPEKDPRAIAAAKNAPSSAYPKCQLCAENEGYSGRMNHPARQNHRTVPVTLDGCPWFLQYSPYVYYNEHCIVFSRDHAPMVIDEACLRKLLDFVRQFPHYFVGSNAGLPIVGGSILGHEHFQGGRYDFAMAKAPAEEELSFSGYPEIAAHIVRWPMSVIRLSGKDPERLASLAGKILRVWQGYTDESVFILAETGGEKHNAVTPIARVRDGAFELDLVLRNNITTKEHPFGVYHAHEEYHHIKKENIGLIEVMGLAVLPPRLKTELAGVRDAILSGRDISSDEALSRHAAWVASLLSRHSFTSENIDGILRREVGEVYLHILENAGVFKRDEAGKKAFLRFADAVSREK